MVSTSLRLTVLVKVDPIIVHFESFGLPRWFHFDRYGHLYDDAEFEVADRFAALLASRPAPTRAL